MLAAFDPTLNPWRFQAHPEVWLLVVALVGSYIYAVRVIGPRVVPAEQAGVSRKQITAFVTAMTMLLLASDWPVHDIAEEYLYSVHMLQHMVLSYLMPPLVLLATPEWLLRAIVGERRAYKALAFVCKPVVAGVAFNAVVMVTHIPGVVNASASATPLHYSVHVALVTTSLIMWMPVVGPFAELHIGPMAKMIYLFLQSVVPTVPAGWLTFAEGVVYKHYDISVRVWGISATTDQQLAGAIMKIGGSVFLWSIILVMFIRKCVRPFRSENGYRTFSGVPGGELTFREVEEAFSRTPPAPEPERTPRPS